MARLSLITMPLLLTMAMVGSLLMRGRCLQLDR